MRRLFLTTGTPPFFEIRLKSTNFAAIMAARNYTISIVKGIGIILMVVGHAEAPWFITNFIYTFHMPLFFIAAGYFFSRKYLNDPWTFISRRIKGLYVPFVTWAVIFLVLHNLWFKLGLLNEAYGNWTGGVTHPYTVSQFWTRLMLIFTNMSGYDEFMAGAFWFFRGLLLASVLFLLLYKLIDSRTNLRPAASVTLICLLAVAFTAFHISTGVKIKAVPNGFWREVWGIFFFGIGVLYRQYEGRIREHRALFVAYFLLLCGAAWLHLSGMNNGGRFRDLWSLPVTGCLGWLMVHYMASRINRREGRLRRLLVFIGDNTLYVFILHIISFKIVSAIKIMYYGLPTEMIGCHMVIHYNNTDFFWPVYSVVGVAVPLLALAGVRYLRGYAGRRLALWRGADTANTDVA